MRKEAALLVGALGSLIVLGIQVSTGAADVSEVGPAVGTVAAIAAPLASGYVIRFLVWSKNSVERLIEGAPPIVDVLVDTYGAPAAVEGLKQAVEYAKRRIDPSDAGIIDIAR